MTEAAQAVQDLIDALPSVDSLDITNVDALNELYEQVQAADTAYQELSEEEQAEVDDSKLDELFSYINSWTEPVDDASSDTVTVNFDVTYCQTEARTMLDMINTFRTGSDAWYWNEDNETKTTCSDLSELVYDYDLEAVAMQRAAEIALYWSHTRPNGEKYSTAWDSSYYWTIRGENIATGTATSTAEAAFTLWQETDEDYDGQGHRRNMLESSYTKIGIACVYCNGCYYWVQELAGSTNTSTEVDANDSETTVSVELLSDSVTVISDLSGDVTAYEMETGESKSLPVISGTIQYSGSWPSGKSYSITIPASSLTWSVSDTSVASVDAENSTLSALATGSTTLSTSVFGSELSIPVMVTAKTTDTQPVSACTISLSETSYTYDGTAKTPTVTVTNEGTTLTEDTDYTLSYSDNRNAGTATVTITGAGNYSGSVEKTFTISPKTLTATIVSADGEITKTYDGTTDAPDGLSISLTGVVDGDSVSAEAESYTYNSADVDTADTVTASGITLSGDDAGNYILSSDIVTADAKITQEGVLYSGTYEVGSSNVKWVIYESRLLTVDGTGEFKTISNYGGWHAYETYRDYITSAEVHLSGTTDLSYMFADLPNLKSVDLSGLDTTDAIYVQYMFSGCSSLTELDLSSLDTSNVTNMGSMFYNCSNLTELDLSGLDTGNVTNMGYMFSGCSSLTELDLSGLDTGNVTYMYSMFNNCSSLTELDLSSLDTGNVTLMYSMFSDCSSLKSLNLSGFDTANVTSTYKMFYNCSSLESIDLSGWNTSNVTDLSYMFYNCSSLAELDVSKLVTSSAETLYQMFKGCGSLTSLDAENWDLSGVTNISYIFSGCSGLASLKISSWNTSSVTEMSGTFAGCSGLTDINISNWDTSNVEDMGSMFAGCSGLTSLDLSGFDTGKVTSMSYMFSNCTLTTLDLSSFDTSNVTEMKSMFYQDANLAALDLSSFDTGRVTDMRYMFADCSGLTSLDLSSFDTGSVTNMSYMFQNCKGLTSLDVSTWDVSSVETMYDIFHYCSSLTGIDLSGWNTESLTDMYGMFAFCKSLTELDLSSFDADSVTRISYLVYQCSSLKTLDLRDCNFGTVYLCNSVLTGCSSLNKIYAPIKLKDSVSLPDGTWYIASGSKVTTLPMNLSASVIVQKGSVPSVLEKGAAPVLDDKIIYDGEDIATENGTVDLKQLLSAYGTLTGATLGTVKEDNTIAGDVLSGTPSISSKYVLSYSTNTGEEGDFVTIPLTISFKDYEDAQLNIIIRKGREELSFTGFTVASHTYNGNAYVWDGELVILDSSDVDVTDEVSLTVSYTGTSLGGETYESETAPTNAGSYTLTLTVDETSRRGSYTCNFEITQASLIVTADDVYVSLGTEDADAAIMESLFYTTRGFYGADTFVEGYYPVLSYTKVDASLTGVYTIEVYGADAGYNYAITYVNGTLRVSEEKVGYTVTFETGGYAQVDDYTGVVAGSTISAPEDPTADGYVFRGWYKDAGYATEWDFSSDTVTADTTLYAKWTAEQKELYNLQISAIADCVYTGSALKPAVSVYDGDTLLKAGKDYSVSYKNNTNANANESAGGTGTSLTDTSNGFDPELPYVVITGKGNYTSTLYVNFNIKKASISDSDGSVATGVTLKYTEQSVVNTKKAVSVFSSLKYKKALKLNQDFSVDLELVSVQNADGETVTQETVSKSDADLLAAGKIPAGYSGEFTLVVTALEGNYSGEIRAAVYVAAKTSLIKNASITVGKNQKTWEYSGKSVTLTPGYYDKATKGYYTDDLMLTSLEAADCFVVKMSGNSLVYGEDYTVSYKNNNAVGTATMTITGINGYVGSKSVTFKITGTAFSKKNVSITGVEAKYYTGSAITQNSSAVVTDKDENTLVYGEDYTITYKNNIKKGTATMTFKGLESAGYTGSINVTFRIQAAELDAADATAVVVNGGEDVPYSKGGAKPEVSVTYNGKLLTQGTDYTVKYTNNNQVADSEESDTNPKPPTVTITGKGNYAGSVSQTFTIIAKDLSSEDITATSASVILKSSAADEYEYTPAITLKDGTKKLSANTDYSKNVTYHNYSQEAITAYLKALAEGTADTANRPYVTVSAGTNGCYTGSVDVDLAVYSEKLTSSNLYIVVGDAGYTGEQVTPEVTVYHLTGTDKNALKNVKNKKTTLEEELEKGTVELLAEDSDYTLSWGTNVAAGKNKGSVTVNGTAPFFGGSVKAVFTIANKTLPHEHSYAETVITAATCQKTGLVYCECTLCGASEYRELKSDPDAHDYRLSSSRAATCTEDGEEVYSCVNDGCEAAYTVSLSATGHTYGEVQTDAEGKQYQECAAHDSILYLDSEDEEEEEPHTHTYVATGIEATYTEAGSITYTCECGEIYTVQSVEALGHNYVKTSETAATCETAGSITYTCSRCGDSYTETTAALDHDYVKTGETAATCTVDGYTTYTCSRCGDSYMGTIAALGHNYVTSETAATCTTAGYTTYTCSGCGDSYTVAGAAATGHDFGEWETVREAALGVDGLKKHNCSVCGAVETQSTPMLTDDGHDQVYYIRIGEDDDGLPVTQMVIGHFDEARTNLMLEKINAYRIANGKDALLVNDALQIYTELRAVETAYKWAHIRSNGSTLPTKFGENIAYTFYYSYWDWYGYDMDSEDMIEADVNEILSAWQNSSGHNNNILGTYYDYIYTGLSCFMYKTVDDYGDLMYKELWVQTFSTYSDAITTKAATNATYDFQ